MKIVAASDSPPSSSDVDRKSWPHFSTPLSMFLAVMLPITALMLALALLDGMPNAIRWSAAGVVGVSLYAYWKGYLHRLEIDRRHVRYRTLTRTITIPWSDIRRIDRYTPPDRNPLTQYVYITRADAPPPDRYTLSEETIQLQDRPGLLESLHAAWARAGARDSGSPGSMRK